MTILVTGAAGFIGYHTAARLLDRGERILGIDNLNSYYSRSLKLARIAALEADYGGLFNFMPCDFSDAEHLSRVTSGRDIYRIVHLGAQAGVRYSIENPSAYVTSNLVGHANILELARTLEVGHLVYASSSSVYGGNEKLPFSVADRVDRPLSFYAATKRADELMSETYAHLYRIPQTGLRFFTVYGPWGRPDMAVWKFTQAIFEQKLIPLYNGGAMRRDFTFIGDVAPAIVACLDRPPGAAGAGSLHRIYNIGNNRSEELMRLLELIENACGQKARVELHDRPAEDLLNTFADIAPAQADFGYDPKTSIDVGVPAFVQWYRAFHG